MEEVEIFKRISILTIVAAVLAVVALFFIANYIAKIIEVKRMKKELQKTIKEKDEQTAKLTDKNKKIDTLKETLMKKNEQLEELDAELSILRKGDAIDYYIDVINALDDYCKVNFITYGTNVSEYLIQMLLNEKSIIETIKSGRSNEAKEIEISNIILELKAKINHICAEMERIQKAGAKQNERKR